MNSKLFFLLFVLCPLTSLAQEYIEVKNQYNASDKWKEIGIEIINKSYGEMIISNAFPGGELRSFFKVDFLDKNGQKLEATERHIPFIEGLEKPQMSLIIAPHSSIIFKYSYDSLARYCEESDRIKQMVITYHFQYTIRKDGQWLVKPHAYEDFSQKIVF